VKRAIQVFLKKKHTKQMPYDNEMRFISNLQHSKLKPVDYSVAHQRRDSYKQFQVSKDQMYNDMRFQAGLVH